MELRSVIPCEGENKQQSLCVNLAITSDNYRILIVVESKAHDFSNFLKNIQS